MDSIVFRYEDGNAYYITIKDRKKTAKSEYISLDEVAEKFDIDVKSL